GSERRHETVGVHGIAPQLRRSINRTNPPTGVLHFFLTRRGSGSDDLFWFSQWRVLRAPPWGHQEMVVPNRSRNPIFASHWARWNDLFRFSRWQALRLEPGW